MDEAWQQLVARYANGRPLCNCRCAYAATDGRYWMDGKEYNDGHYCKHGCAPNQIAAREEIARRILAGE